MPPKAKQVNHTIASLAARIEALEARCTQLEALNAVKDNTIELLKEHTNTLEQKLERAEQYSKRSCLRIHGVPAPAKGADETPEAVSKIVEDAHKQLGVRFDGKNIDRAHRIGKPVTKDGKTTQSVIIKFTNWNARCDFYRARPTKTNGIKVKGFTSVGLDLTKHRLDLLTQARELVEQSDRGSYALSDINCNLMVKFNDGKLKMFSTIEELKDMLE